MNTAVAEAADPKPGHNQPPITPPNTVEIQRDIEERYPDVQKRLEELVKSAKECPDVIEDDDTAGKVQTLIREMTASKSSWGGLRSAEKKPWQQVADTIYTFFKKAEDVLGDKNDGWIPKLKARHTTYLEKKAEAKRLEEERKAREERERAEQAAKEAAEKEERRRAAEERRTEAEEALAEARENTEEELQRGLNAKAEVARLKAEVAGFRRDKDEESLAAAEIELEQAQQEVLDAREELRTKREAQRKAKQEADRKAREEREATTQHKAAERQAERTERGAERQETKAEKVSDTDLSRTRGEHTVGSLSGRWEPRVVDRGAVPLEELRGYFMPDAVDAAIYRWMRERQKDWEADKRAGKKSDALAGVIFVYNPEGRVS